LIEYGFDESTTFKSWSNRLVCASGEFQSTPSGVGPCSANVRSK
jgi:hypothetical protein